MKTKYIITIISVILSFNLNAQIKVKTDGKVRIGSGTLNPGSTLEVQEYNKTTEIRIFATSPNIARIWTANSIYAFGFGIDASGNGQIYQNMNSPIAIMTFNSSGYIGIGRSPSYKLDVNGNIRVNSTIYTSDEKLKSNISPITAQTGNLFKLRSVSYNLNTTGLKSASNVVETETINSDNIVNKQEEQDRRIHYGFIAQEVKEIYPELVYEDKEGILGIDYVSFIPLLVAELKLQTETINNLKQEIETLKATNGNILVTSANKSFGELFQNYPNPFDEGTTIKFRLSSNVNSAAIYLYDLQGNQIKSYSISNANESLEIKASELKPGMYIYSLIANGNLIDTKTMILTE